MYRAIARFCYTFNVWNFQSVSPKIGDQCDTMIYCTDINTLSFDENK